MQKVFCVNRKLGFDENEMKTGVLRQRKRYSRGNFLGTLIQKDYVTKGQKFYFSARQILDREQFLKGAAILNPGYLGGG